MVEQNDEQRERGRRERQTEEARQREARPDAPEPPQPGPDDRQQEVRRGQQPQNLQHDDNAEGARLKR